MGKKKVVDDEVVEVEPLENVGENPELPEMKQAEAPSLAERAKASGNPRALRLVKELANLELEVERCRAPREPQRAQTLDVAAQRVRRLLEELVGV